TARRAAGSLARGTERNGVGTRHTPIRDRAWRQKVRMAAGDAQIIAQAVTQLGKLMGADTINTIKSDLEAVEADVAGKADLVGGNEFSGAQVGPFVDNGGAVYNVKAFGGTGDGAPDDAAAIQNALDAIPAGSTRVCPPGVYAVSSRPLRWTGTQHHIQMTGAATGY